MTLLSKELGLKIVIMMNIIVSIEQVVVMEVAENRGRFGLGYKPTNIDKRRIALERKEKCLACLQGHEPRVERVPIFHISKSFRSARWMYAGQVAMLKEEVSDDMPNWV